MANPPPRATTKVIIVGGAGTIGSSTALHLLRAGYSPANLTVLDVYPFPSSQSAGNDLNKIMGIRVSSKAEVRLSKEAADMWSHDDLFKPFFHKTGRMDCEVSEEGVAALWREYQTLIDVGVGETHEWLDTEDKLLEKAPLLPRDNIKGWKALYSHDGGWLAAAKAINAIGEFCRDQGVQFGFGGAGSFKRPLFGSEDPNTCIGVETEDGTQYFGDKVVIAAGAWSPTLIDLEDQCCSKAWVYAHIQLTPEEALEYKGVPVVYHSDIGFFFEPNENGVIKVCDEFPGYTRYKMHQPYGAESPVPVSVPRSHAKHPTDTYPDASEVTIRKAISTYLPRFEGKKLFNRALCWCTDTADSSLLICEHPKWKNLILATGDSGHTFKLLPSIGKHVVELIEDNLAEDLAREWRWRPGSGDARKSTRAAPAKDLADMPGWNHDDGNSNS
ncbi:FAD dependent oxidoreductase [Cryphonectria parasitica EP155]|uniref:FAD dependent oxidoreductase n=1 Tax=Cryphonectria parasitica (strain ATCC 38755 / EP155) TaxID=660469 RepID=A0A9P5CP77_CRYP1|nr:FAD dependent oxidoreductase [Cryphonectria parasitica EP155]KAF3766204.1 FAD dependent oxidoreductase [Cryphonectria parasitica EP155]